MKGLILKLLMAMALVCSCQSHATCNNNIQEVAPDMRFTINDDGTVTDHKTDLIWMRCSLGQTLDGGYCSGTASTMDWADALNLADTTEFADYSDWRLPDIKELISIVETACYSPAINSTIFPDTDSGDYHSSSPSSFSGDEAWNVNFNYGGASSYYKSSSNRVRLVRTAE